MPVWSPEDRLLSAFGKILTNKKIGQTHFDDHLAKIVKKNSEFEHPGHENDKLFDSRYPHGDREDCSECDTRRLVIRPKRVSTKLVYHQSTILSGNGVVKNGVMRDKISKDNYDARCFEMEAAGVMDETRCLVIRGIADYADGHKNWRWHDYAAATAAAFAREFLLTLEPVVLERLAPMIPQLSKS